MSMMLAMTILQVILSSLLVVWTRDELIFSERVLDLYWDTSPRDPNKTVPVMLSADCH